MVFKILKGGLEIEAYSNLCITIKHYETRDKVKVTKVM
jgi:hypothetical protein